MSEQLHPRQHFIAWLDLRQRAAWLLAFTLVIHGTAHFTVTGCGSAGCCCRIVMSYTGLLAPVSLVSNYCLCVPGVLVVGRLVIQYCSPAVFSIGVFRITWAPAVTAGTPGLILRTCSKSTRRVRTQGT